MIAPASSHNWNARLGRIRIVMLRSLVSQVFLLATLFGGPGLARQAPEVETHGETSIALMQTACDRTSSSRLRTRSLTISVVRSDVLVRSVRWRGSRPARSIPPHWLRSDLPGPLLC
jgi:hypothetical protein